MASMCDVSIREALKAGEPIQVRSYVKFLSSRFNFLNREGKTTWPADMLRLFADSADPSGTDRQMIGLTQEQIAKKSHPLGSQYAFQLAMLCGSSDDKVRITSVDICDGKVIVKFQKQDSHVDVHIQQKSGEQRKYATTAMKFTESGSIEFETLCETAWSRRKFTKTPVCNNALAEVLWQIFLNTLDVLDLFRGTPSDCAFKIVAEKYCYTFSEIEGAVNFIGATFAAMILTSLGKIMRPSEDEYLKLITLKVRPISESKTFRLYKNYTDVYMMSSGGGDGEKIDWENVHFD